MTQLTRKTMKIVNIYVTITVIFVKMMRTVKIFMINIWYYAYIGRYKYEYLNDSNEKTSIRQWRITKTKYDLTRRDKTRQINTRPDKTIQDKTTDKKHHL